MSETLAKRAYSIAASIVVAGLTMPGALGDAFADRRSDFVAAGRCKVERLLHLIHNQPDEQNRFLVVSVRGKGQAYVQCLLMNRDTRLLCEASSGYFAVLPGKRRPTEMPMSKVAVLDAAGFDTDTSDRNYQRMLAIRNVDTDFAAAADLVLSLIHDIYDARAIGELEFKAPLAASAARTSLHCQGGSTK